MSGVTIADKITLLLQPSVPVIVLSLVIAFLVPFLVHYLIYRSPSNASLPCFLLIGPADAGKTTLATLFERGTHATTRTSQHPLEVEVSLPVANEAASGRYRSVNDPSLRLHKVFLLIDTPGHGKLRHYALERISQQQNLRGVIFLVDAANISSSEGELRTTAEYLHDVFLLLQRRQAKSSSAQKSIPVLIAANKQDLFTALPVPLLKKVLEAEITSIRKSRAKGLLDSGIGTNDVDMIPEKEWLGEGGEGGFEFNHMEELGIEVECRGGAVISSQGPNVEKWWQWVADYL